MKIKNKKIREIYEYIMSLLNDGEELLYIAGTDKLPEPLSVDEEKEMLDRLAAGDDDARKKLVEKNLRLVVYIAKKFENSGVNIEDLISIGTIGLMKGVNSFNLDKNIKLATYASRCIENEILMFLRKTQRTKTEVSIDEPINTDSEGNDLALGDILGTDNDSLFKQVEDNDNKKIINMAIKNLDFREKEIMELRYGFDGKKELTQKEVADKLGISQSYISRIEKKVINRLKKKFDVAQ
ncbi:MAG: RNA polymerase sporulation sigma factor SigK [Clostridia bacterium]|nr:RNA polymerase sporulation sigma factor SigK [Clostridia bacterium]MBR6641373.1 RNA polymerase sporulation sigma factor SigK [Clostridia bacterium]